MGLDHEETRSVGVYRALCRGFVLHAAAFDLSQSGRQFHHRPQAHRTARNVIPAAVLVFQFPPTRQNDQTEEGTRQAISSGWNIPYVSLMGIFLDWASLKATLPAPYAPPTTVRLRLVCLPWRRGVEQCHQRDERDAHRG